MSASRFDTGHLTVSLTNTQASNNETTRALHYPSFAVRNPSITLLLIFTVLQLETFLLYIPSIHICCTDNKSILLLESDFARNVITINLFFMQVYPGTFCVNGRWITMWALKHNSRKAPGYIVYFKWWYAECARVTIPGCLLLLIVFLSVWPDSPYKHRAVAEQIIRPNLASTSNFATLRST